MTVDPRPERAPTPWRPRVAEGLHRLPIRVHRWLPAEQRADLRHWLGRFHPAEEGADLTPPAPAPGEVVGPPEYVGVGTTAAGVGWWHRLVTDHPGVSARADLPPARHYLSHFGTEAFGPEQVAGYHGWFPRRRGSIAGEWTPTYSSLPWVPPLLALAAPDARVLLMVRDPVERLRVALAGNGERRVSQAGTAIADSVEGGFYAAHLHRLYRHLPASRVLVLQYERCRRDRDGQLAATYRFLGLDDSHRPPAGHRPSPPGREGVPELDADTRARLVELYADDVADLVGLVPELDVSLWPGFGRG